MDGFNYLSAAAYMEIRLKDQLNFFQKKSVRLERQLEFLSSLIIIIGGVGTYLAVIGMQVWITVTTSMVTAIGAYLGYRQTENALVKYNQTATDLFNIKIWWDALSSEDQFDKQKLDSLVEQTEQVLASELRGWVGQMQNDSTSERNDKKPGSN
jgi:hypothetical protein